MYTNRTLRFLRAGGHCQPPARYVLPAFPLSQKTLMRGELAAYGGDRTSHAGLAPFFEFPLRKRRVNRAGVGLHAGKQFECNRGLLYEHAEARV